MLLLILQQICLSVPNSDAWCAGSGSLWVTGMDAILSLLERALWGTASEINNQFSSVQLLSRVRLFATPSTEARQASLSITNSPSSPKPMSIESVMPSSHLILCHPLLLLPPNPPSIRDFSNESTLRMRWPKY